MKIVKDSPEKVKHTPGPWTIDGLHCRGCNRSSYVIGSISEYVHDNDCRGVDFSADSIEAVVDDERQEIVTCDSGVYGPHNGDLFLIAAAPDLLAACKKFVEAYEKSLQLEKTDVAVRLAHAAIDKAEGRS